MSEMATWQKDVEKSYYFVQGYAFANKYWNTQKALVLAKKMHEGQYRKGGAEFIMNGRMLPVAMVDCENCVLESVSIDTRVPQITQVEVIENDTENGYITYRVAPYANYKIVIPNSLKETYEFVNSL